MMSDELRQSVANADLKELAELFQTLAQKVYAHRKDNNGFVPREIFAACISIGGIYPCVEIIVQVVSKEGRQLGYALKKRNKGKEQGWQNQYQIPGVAGRITDDQTQVFDRLSKEIFGESRPMKLQHLGCEIHNEPERLATCWTLVYLMKIDQTLLKQLSGIWKIFTNIDNSGIVDHHRKTLRWASDCSRPLLADLR